MIALTLASTSASRSAILEGAGVAFETMAPGVDEGEIKDRLLSTGEGPLQIALALAALKAMTASRGRRGLVIGADQTLEIDGELLDKARSLDEARRRLLALRGRAHLLHSAVALAEDGAVVWRAHETARLAVRDFSDEFLAAYLDQEGERILDSVGGYRLEGLGAQLFAAIEGDYFSVLGLPLLPLLAQLRERGAVAS
ncbi:MAG TPA: Maf family protein [Caulobacteraceae bacterium]